MKFGHSVTERFFARFDFTRLLRGHQFCLSGLKTDHGGKCLTVFSAPNYMHSKNIRTYVMRSSGQDGLI